MSDRISLLDELRMKGEGLGSAYDKPVLTSAIRRAVAEIERLTALAAQQDGVRDAAQFLVDRLEEFNIPADGPAEVQWYGFVVPALERLMHALEQSPGR